MKHYEQIQMGFYESADSGATVLPVSFSEWEERAKQKLAAGPLVMLTGQPVLVIR